MMDAGRKTPTPSSTTLSGASTQSHALSNSATLLSFRVGFDCRSSRKGSTPTLALAVSHKMSRLFRQP
jgi:hypothetical protein